MNMRCKVCGMTEPLFPVLNVPGRKVAPMVCWQCVGRIKKIRVTHQPYYYHGREYSSVIQEQVI